MGLLTAQQVEEYHRVGFIKVDVLPNEIKENLSAWIDEIKNDESNPHYMRYNEISNRTGDKMLCRIENFADYHGHIGSLIKSTLSDMVEQLWGHPALPYKEKINFKLPGANGFLPHQDAPAFGAHTQDATTTTQPPYVQRCSVMVAVDASFPLNGGLDFVAEVHREKFAYLHDPVTGELDKTKAAQWAWQPLHCVVGDVVLFDAYVPHRSGPNTTDAPRRAIYITYAPTAEGDQRKTYYEQKRDLFPPDNERVPGKDYSEGRRIFNLGNPII